MKNFRFILILLFTLFLIDQNTIFTKEKTATLIIKVNGFKNTDGVLHTHIFNQQLADYFPSDSEKAFSIKSVEINKDETIIIHENLPYGTYAGTVHHDINNNNKLDKNWIGYPAEPFGLTTNPKLVLKIPKFSQCSFEVIKDTVIIHVQLKFI